MNIDEALFKHLSNTPGIRELVANRIYPLLVRQGSPNPSIVYQRIANPSVHAMGTDIKIRQPKYQISIWADSYGEVMVLSEQVELALRDFSGLMGGSNGVGVQRVFYEGEISGSEPETKEYRNILEFVIWYEE